MDNCRGRVSFLHSLPHGVTLCFHEPVPFMRRKMVAEAWPMLSLLVGVAGLSLIVHGIIS
jgi:hypothetical protein